MFLYVSPWTCQQHSRSPKALGPIFDIFRDSPRRHLGESNRWSALPLPPPSSSAPELLIGCRSLMQIANGEDFAVKTLRNLRDITLFCLTNMGSRLIGNHFPYQKHYCHLAVYPIFRQSNIGVTWNSWAKLRLDDYFLELVPILAPVQGEWTGSPIFKHRGSVLCKANPGYRAW